MMNVSHPVFFVKNMFNHDGVELFFSKYSYVKDSLLDDRVVFSVDSSRVDEKWLEKERQSLSESQELAFHSTVKKGGRHYHIPLIDFSVDEWDADYVLSRMMRFIPKKIINNMAVFDSGRSFHGYSQSILSPKEWKEYMGRLLLVNPPGGHEIIDSRWVGHRIVGGYCSLRWSNNTGFYLKVPSRIKFP